MPEQCPVSRGCPGAAQIPRGLWTGDPRWHTSEHKWWGLCGSAPVPQSTSASGGAELVLWLAGQECAQVSSALPVPIKPCAGAGRSNKAPRGQLMRCLPPSPARAVLGLPAHGAGAGLCGDPRCCPWGHPAWSCSCPHSRAPGDTPADGGQLQGCLRVGRGWCCSPCSCWGLLAPGRAPALCPLLGTGAGLLPKGVARHGSPAAPGSAA